MKTILQIALGLLTLSAARLSLHGQTITASAGGSSFSSSATSVDDLDDFTFDFQGDKAKIERYTIFESPYYRYDDPTTEADFPSQFEIYGDRQPKTEEQIISYSESYSQGEIKMLDYSKTTHSLQLVASKPMPQAVTIKFLRFNTIPVVDSMNPALYYEPSENDSWGHFATNPAYVGHPNPEKYKYDKFETLELSIPAGGTKSNSFELEAPTAIDINSQILSGVSNSLGVEAHTIASQSVIRAGLRVDQNRDGRMTTTDLLTNTAEKPFRFWSNDDDEPAPQPPPPAAPLAPIPDYTNSAVDGPDDIKDFFPVVLDIKQLLTVLPHTSGVTYKLKQEDGALNFVYTSLTRATAFNYLLAGASIGYGPNAAQGAATASTQQITATGVELSTTFLDRIKDQNQGVILIEGRNSTIKPLVLSVEKGGVEITKLELHILPSDLDINHPATGIFAENKEDVGDGGFIPIERDATTPRTGLLIKSNTALGAAGGKYRLKFANGTRYQVYQDYARTQPVISEQTEFAASVPHALHLHGLQKSLTRGGEKITLQAWWSGRWIDTDEIKLTVVQSEFLIQVKAFIPYTWTEAESEIPGPNFLNPLNGKVVAGDYNAAARPSFKNAYSDDNDSSSGFFNDAPFRVCQTVIITPYEDLHATPDIVLKRALMTAPLSEHFVKATSVHPSEMSLEHGYLPLTGTHSGSGKPPAGPPAYTAVARTGKTSELTLHGSGTDGAMGSILGVPIEWFTADIQWTLTLKIKADSNPLAPEIEYAGEHDSFPAYEIIVIQSDGTYKHVHQFMPPPSAKPGPESLNDNNALTIGRTDTINQ